MPPKIKFTKEQILDVAVELVREQGIHAVTARELGAKLGVSVKPIFTAFENMHEVKCETIKRIIEIYQEYQKDYTNYTSAFKRHGMQMIKFAKEEPKFFDALFMQKEKPQNTFDASVNKMLEGNDELLNVIMSNNNLSKDQAIKLFKLIWVQTFGIAVLIAQGVCQFTEQEVSEMLSTAFIGILTAIKSGVVDVEYLKKQEIKHK